MSEFLGVWKIVETQVWAVDDLELLGPAEIVFRGQGLGSFRLVAIQGDVDYRLTGGPDGPMAEFSWSGYDDADASSGRGWARIESGSLKGKLFIHMGDESGFTAVRIDPQRTK